jgi:hypothetical protein
MASASRASISEGSGSASFSLTRDTESDSRGLVSRNVPPDSISHSSHDCPGACLT